MRNPLNSIIALDTDFAFQLEKMKDTLALKEKALEDEPNKNPHCKKHLKEMKKTFSQLTRISESHSSSSKLLLFFVKDILDFSNIKANKFKQEATKFNIVEAVKEII